MFQVKQNIIGNSPHPLHTYIQGYIFFFKEHHVSQAKDRHRLKHEEAFPMQKLDTSLDHSPATCIMSPACCFMSVLFFSAKFLETVMYLSK